LSTNKAISGKNTKKKLATGIGFIVVEIGALIIIIGSILPWEQVERAHTNIVDSKSGTQGIGVVALVAGIIVLVMGFLMPILEDYGFAAIISILGGIGCIAIVVIKFISLAAQVSNIAITPHPGKGMDVVALGGFLVIFGAVIGLVGAPAKGPKLQGYICPYCGNLNQSAMFCSGCGARFPQP
jgi:hypothetical protein